MRRRAATPPGGMPAHLATHDPAVWPGRDSAERYSAWMHARQEWAAANGVAGLPGEAEAWANFPDGEFRPEDV